MIGHGFGNTGLLGGDTGRPCPLDADAAAVAFVKQYQDAIDWAINVTSVPQHERADVRQEVSLRILHRFRKHGPLYEGGHRSYAITVARHAALDSFRARKVNRPSAELPTMEQWLTDDQLLPDELLQRKDGHERLHLAIASLTPLKRYVVRRVLEGASLVEVAKEMERQHGTVKVLHHRAVQDLRRRLVQ
ncbi:MAG TPA: sigma-70 family RNA polymerase sigma factor [Flavobacteriales bacterium]|nr:sigma-70 family RNA polymerase sigma factor [Flavobacteriales bacterium]HQY04134.1 sigma-70 family RNA polymerase sigma factor [Flavobacteriales bacterium]